MISERGSVTDTVMGGERALSYGLFDWRYLGRFVRRHLEACERTNRYAANPKRQDFRSLRENLWVIEFWVSMGIYGLDCSQGGA